MNNDDDSVHIQYYISIEKESILHSLYVLLLFIEKKMGEKQQQQKWYSNGFLFVSNLYVLLLYTVLYTFEKAWKSETERMRLRIRDAHEWTKIILINLANSKMVIVKRGEEKNMK